MTVMLGSMGGEMLAAVVTACLLFWAMILVGVLSMMVWLGAVLPVRGALRSRGGGPGATAGRPGLPGAASAFAEAVARGDFAAAERAAARAFSASVEDPSRHGST